MEDDELQRRELSRLLSTAKDKDRQELILKAINALDEQEKVTTTNESSFKPINFHGMSPTMHANLLMGENLQHDTTLLQMPVLESVTMTPGGSARMRPMSARRRPSVPNLLDAIPEIAPRSHLVNRNEEIVLPIEDIAEVVASSHDRRFPPKNIFRHSQQAGRSSEFSSIAAITTSNPSNFGEYFNSMNNSFGTYTPDTNQINSNTGHNTGLASASLSNNSSASNLSVVSAAPSSSSGLLAPVAQRRTSHRTATGPGGGGGERGGREIVKGWLSTGIAPQFLHVAFYEKWEVKKIEVYCSGIEKLCVQICASAAAALKSSANAMEMVHLGKGAFVWDAGGSEDTFDNTVGGLPGISATFFIRATSSLFVHVSEIRITVHPYT